MEDNPNPAETQNAEPSTQANNASSIYQENVRSITKGKYKAQDIVDHLTPLHAHCHTDLMKATYSAIMDDFKTKAKIDESGKGMKFLEKLHEIAIEVRMADAALKDRTEAGIEHKLKQAEKTRNTLFDLDGVATPPQLHNPDYLTPVERLGRIQFIVKTYTSEDFYKLITQITDDLYSGDDEKLILLRNKHSRDSAIASLKIREFEDRAKLRVKWQNIVDEDTKLIENSQHFKMHQKESHLKQCNADIKVLS